MLTMTEQRTSNLVRISLILFFLTTAIPTRGLFSRFIHIDRKSQINKLIFNEISQAPVPISTTKEPTCEIAAPPLLELFILAITTVFTWAINDGGTVASTRATC